jgi:tRNA(Ile2) C34 agmatinyltransferase TiaS
MTPAELTHHHPLATEIGVRAVLGMLLYQGAMCPRCGHGTRAAGKKWRKCPKCGRKFLRKELPEDRR